MGKIDKNDPSYYGDYHFVTQCHQRQFRSSFGLYELVKASGIVHFPPKQVDKSGKLKKEVVTGSRNDLWNKQIEETLMSEWDSHAHQIYQFKVVKPFESKIPISLTEDDKDKLSLWFLSLVRRNPSMRNIFDFVRNSARTDVEWIKSEISSQEEKLIARVKADHPEHYAAHVERFGVTITNMFIMDDVKNGVIGNMNNFDYTDKMAMQKVLTSKEFDDMIVCFDNRKWTWLKTDHTFVLGDNPVCRIVSGSPVPVVPIGNPGVEFIIPLTPKVSLWLHRRDGIPDEMVLNEQETAFRNRWQVYSAVDYVWSDSEDVLKKAGLDFSNHLKYIQNKKVRNG